MQVIGWASILMGLLHFRMVSGILLTMIGIAVVYVERKNEKEESKFSLSVLQANIKRMRRTKKAQGIVRRQGEGDFPTNDFLTSFKIQPKVKKMQKPDWFF